jgi:hypothetical protein
LLQIMKLQGWNRHEEKQKQKIKVFFFVVKEKQRCWMIVCGLLYMFFFF